MGLQTAFAQLTYAHALPVACCVHSLAQHQTHRTRHMREVCTLELRTDTLVKCSAREWERTGPTVTAEACKGIPEGYTGEEFAYNWPMGLHDIAGQRGRATTMVSSPSLCRCHGAFARRYNARRARPKRDEADLG